ncbi:unnamed protein product [Adineta steineri]|uniref:T-box domain-containing protein n=1 Tax=Adineta steineri TaxID=433720 RepID=A0A813XR29_9BILA|nr:unnamed protein product [Adineta steineri]CAF0870546.1 unnamed protein product [Adineta steineri]CAF1015931.1 unnamed protein product [Adineta steineri]
MLTPLDTRDDVSKIPTEYYYTHQQSHPYYCSLPFNDNSNNLHHYRPSIYETNHYYPLSNQVNSNTQVSSTVYRPNYHQDYSSEEHGNEIVYSQKPSTYNHNLSSSIPTLPSNVTFQQHSSFVQNSNTNNVDYLTSPSNGSCQSNSVIVELVNRPLWMKFASHTHENIITKPGRRMFPVLEFKVYGLKPEVAYEIYVDMVLVDVNYWKFTGKWMPTEQAEQCQKTSHHYLHPDSPTSGAQWMKYDKISFSKLKLTNNKQLTATQSKNQNTIILNSMHKYIPRLNIVEVNGKLPDLISSSNRNGLLPKHTFTFPETEFIAVTAYQNTDITQLKIDNNPFAKGFRDSADNRMTYNPYSYESGNNLPVDYYDNTYEDLQAHKKRRYQ